ncbi:MAG: GHKL domain-containing protein [Clostridiaceae bacterium]|nr:GHKL domain-containing protein [Clostridiaceae bacterium]
MFKIIAVFVVVLIIILVIKLLCDQYVKKQILKFQDELISKHCNEVQNIYTDMRGWKHDFHNHLQVIKAHISLNNLAELDSYVDKLIGNFNNLDFLIKTGNITTDAILNSKISLARGNKIKLDITATVPRELNVSDVDLCVIVGNLIDNAIEACLKINDINRRFIRIYIGILKKQLYISITNSTCEKKRNLSNVFVSIKGVNHGLGLKRIDSTVKKYGGYINRQNEPEVFATEVMIPL